MSASSNLDRRAFLKSTAAGGAALVVGFHFPLTAFPQQTQQRPPINPFSAWVRISQSGEVTLTMAKSEMGQGVMTALPMILAEELDVEWSHVRVEQARTDPQTYSHGTGGSGSVADSYLPLRRAGAAARAMLVAAAAQNWNVDTSSCRTQAGKVIHGPRNTVLTYGDLVEAASKLPIPDLNKVTLKNPADFTIIGKPTPRRDTPLKTNGAAIFGLDVRVPGMLYVVVARCPTFGGRAKSFNADKAREVPGVREVVQIDPISAGANSAGGVAVVAENTWAAMQGRDALQIEWDLGPHASESSESLSQKFGELIAKTGTVIRNDGDAESALANSARIVEATYDMPLLAHATMEPMNCTVGVRGDSAEAWVPTQGPDWAMFAIAQVTKVAREKITVHTTFMGGGFGRRYQADFVVEAAQVSKAIGKPVQVVWTREDDMQHDFYRQATRQSLAAALDDSGNLVAWRHRIVSTSIRAFWDPPERAKPAQQEVGSAAFIPYASPNYRIEYSNPASGIPVAWWRSVEDSMSGFTVESFVDELAHSVKQDPVKFRLKLIGEQRKVPNALWPEGRALDTARHAGVIKLAAEKSNWNLAMPARHGRGVAATYSFDTYVAQVAEVNVASDGKVRVDRIVCAVDCGRVINPDQVKAQMEGAIIYALSAALHGEITVANGAVQQSNFNDYEVLRMSEAPKIEVFIVPSEADPTGMGEPGVPPTAPAVANAIFAATGKRVRRLPIRAADLSA